MSPPQTLDCPLAILDPLPRCTAAIPGCGGAIRVIPEDFVVEEIPAYLPCGDGDHLFLWVEKRDLAGEALRRVIARALDIAPGDVGMAGLKDRRAVTRQWVSVPRRAADRIGAIDGERVRVVDAVPHRNKLRTGHLDGNRFAIRIRGAAPDAVARILAKVELIERIGLPNFYGAQRMGHGGETLAAGWALACGAGGFARVRLPDGTEHALHLNDRHLRRLAASALQAEVFNRTLADRLAAGTTATVLDGDLCRKCDTGGLFASDDPAREQARLGAGQVELTGPMWGPKMPRPERDARAFEQSVVDRLGLNETHFTALGHLAEGARRALLVMPRDVAVREDDGVMVSFALPAGAFATGLLHELMGPEGMPLDRAAGLAPQVACA